MAMKIALIVNKPEREAEVLGWLSEKMISNNPSTEVRVINFFSSSFVLEVLDFNPQLILTFPFTAVSLSSPIYLLKYLLGCKIICLRTEGVYNVRLSDGCNHTGLDKYGSDLVEYEIFWGDSLRKSVGEKLFEQNKIQDLSQCVTLGSPYLDIYTNKRRLGNIKKSHLPESLKCALDDDYCKVYLILTAFHLADYSDEEFFVAGDLIDTTQANVQQQVSTLQEYRHWTSYSRNTLIEKLIALSQKNLDKLFIVKLHPCEIQTYQHKSIDPYQKLRHFSNICVIDEPIRIASVIQVSDLMVHYGSTAMYEAYLLQKPSCFLRFKELSTFLRNSDSNLFVLEPFAESEREVDVQELETVVSETIQFQKNPEIEEQLKMLFDLDINQNYQPLDKISKFLLQEASTHSRVELDLKSPITSSCLSQWASNSQLTNYFISSIIRYYQDGYISKSIRMLQFLKLLEVFSGFNWQQILDIISAELAKIGYPSALIDMLYTEKSVDNKSEVIYF
jgi:surface carbohydrate biosynthesis protein